MTLGRGLVLLGSLLFAVLAAVAVQLHGAQRESKRAAERRFEQRAHISAALTPSVFDAYAIAGSGELTSRYGGPPAAVRSGLAQVPVHPKFGYVMILEERGVVIARSGVARPERDPGRSGNVTSDVRRTTAGPHVEYRLPFATPAGKRVLVAGLPVSLMRSFLEHFLRRLPNPDGATLVIADGGGGVLARIAPKGHTEPADDRLSVAAKIPDTNWQLRLQADRARVLAGSGGGAWLGWVLVGGLALAILAGLWLCARVIVSSARTSAANGALRESEGKLRALVGALEEAVVLQHADGRVELLNASAKALAGTDAELVTQPMADWLAVDKDGAPMAAAETPAGRSFASGTPQRRVIALDRPDRDRLWCDVSTGPLWRPGEAAPYAVVCSYTDVTERQHLEEHLLDLARRDPLTGLWNRRRFEQDLAHQLERCQRDGERAALVLLDVDDFKQVNDLLGHLAGDEVLCALGDALTTRLRPGDHASRLGGDEFALLLLDVDEHDVARIAVELEDHLRDAATAAQDRTSLSISIGTALLDRSTGSVNEVLEAADRAMYAAKQGRTGRGLDSEALPPAVGATAVMASLRALLAAVNARDSYTATHSREVVTLARGVGRRLGLDETQTSEVEHIALLHDLGKIAVPDAILRKAGPLTYHEQTLMRQHPVVGAEILASMPELAHLAPAVRAEHERWDGGGYPDGLSGEQIPVASRIGLVCDAYHAMTSTRPYRRAMSASAAREEIRREAGAQFCPYASAALLEVLEASRAPGPAAVGTQA
jgi:diguanylate cyclase (GGDEF)-like protein